MLKITAEFVQNNLYIYNNIICILQTLPALVMKIMKGSFDPVPDIYSAELKKLLMSMLHLDPNQRPNAAQIMCQPFMINTIFKLYVDIGSIPCTSRYFYLLLFCFVYILFTYAYKKQVSIKHPVCMMFIDEDRVPSP